MLSEMEDGGHPILEHMDQVVGKLRQVLKHDSAQVWMRVDAILRAHAKQKKRTSGALGALREPTS